MRMMQMFTCCQPLLLSLLQAIRERCGQMIDAAGQAGVKVLCLQEAW
jgi:hypothetical protein